MRATALVLLVCLGACAAPVARGQTLFSAISSDPSLQTLTSLLSATGLSSYLNTQQHLSVWAPTDDAFAALPTSLVTYLKSNVAVLKAILEYHVSPVMYRVSQLTLHQQLSTLEGSHLFVEPVNATQVLGLVSDTCQKDVTFLGDDAACSNGLLQKINQVLIPAGIILPDVFFYVEQRGLGRTGYSGWECRAKGTSQLSAQEEKPVGCAVDDSEQFFFWSNDQNAKPNDSWITRVNYDGTNKTILIQDLYDPQGMDTDPTTKKLYYTEHQGNQVSRANYDGSGIEVLWVGRFNQDFPADVAVDPHADLMFVTVQSVPQLLNGSVIQMNRDGSNLKWIATGLIMNYGLCVDDYNRHVYYIQGGNGGSISCYAYGDTPCNTPDKKNGVILGNLNYPYMCDVDNLLAPYGGPVKIAFSEPNLPGAIYSINNDGSNPQLLSSDLSAPMGVKLGSVRRA